MAQEVVTVNIKADMPSVEEARQRLREAIAGARARGTRVLKIIHGYGSTGTGGALRDALRQSLRRRRKEGLVSLVIHGESWDVFNEAVPDLLQRHPGLRRDPDLGRGNEGITLVELA